MATSGGGDRSELGAGGAWRRQEALAPEAATWLHERLREEAEAPLVPVSDLERAYLRAGADFPSDAAHAPSAERLLAAAPRQLFTPARVKALHRFLGRLDRELDVASVPHIRSVRGVLAGVDPLGHAAAHHPVLLVVLRASLESLHGVDRLRAVLRRVEESAWPADDPAHLVPHERALRWMPVRVPPVDLVEALRALHARPATPPPEGTPAQLPLIDVAARPVVGPAGLGATAREALADRLEAWRAASRTQPEAEALARDLRDRLLGGPGGDAGVEALVRASALELPTRCSAAELTRIDAVIGAHREAHWAAILEYGDYLARARRTDESVRAYVAARALAPGSERPRIDERLEQRRERLAETGGAPVSRTRPDPNQMALRLA